MLVPESSAERSCIHERNNDREEEHLHFAEVNERCIADFFAGEQIRPFGFRIRCVRSEKTFSGWSRIRSDRLSRWFLAGFIALDDRSANK